MVGTRGWAWPPSPCLSCLPRSGTVGWAMAGEAFVLLAVGSLWLLAELS